jgi:hypothetical protein
MDLRTTREDIVSFGGIKEIAVEGLRSSGRIRAKPNTEETHLERAMMIAQHRYDL